MRKVRLLFPAITMIVAAAGVLQIPAQPSPQQSSAAPTFRAGTRLVQVDVIVRGKKGPITGLSQDDFTLLDNGKPQRISVFAVKGTQRSRQAAVPLPPGTVSNRVNRNGQEAASSTIILIDRINTPPDDQHYANQKIVKFLEKRRSQDRLGIYTFGNGLRVVQDLTDDPERLSRAINSLKPQNANHRTYILRDPWRKSNPKCQAPYWMSISCSRLTIGCSLRSTLWKRSPAIWRRFPAGRV